MLLSQQAVLDKVLANDPSIRGYRLGTHTLRKTAYLFAVFGIMLRYEVTGRRRTNIVGDLKTTMIQSLEDDALGKAGRHASMQNASLYYMDCLQKWHTIGVHKDRTWRKNKVSEWKSIFIATKQCPPNLDAPSQTNMSLTQLATWYVSQELKIIPTHNNYHRSLSVACDKPPNRSSCEELKNLLRALPPQLYAKASQCLRQTLDAVYQDGLNAIGTTAAATTATTAITAATGTTSNTVMAINSMMAATTTTTTTPATQLANNTTTAAETTAAGGAEATEVVLATTAAPTMTEAMLLGMTTATPSMIATMTEPVLTGNQDPLEDVDRQKRERNKRRREQREGNCPNNYDHEINAMNECRRKRNRQEIYSLCVAASALSTVRVTEKSRNWVNKIKRTLVGIKACVQEHHAGKLESFLEMEGIFATAQYKCACFKFLGTTQVTPAHITPVPTTLGRDT